MAIKNIIFDIGRVLMDFNPERLAKQYFPNTAWDSKIFHKVFYSRTWTDLDCGLVSIAEASKIWGDTLSIDAEKLEVMLNGLGPHLKPFEGSISKVQELKKDGFALYVLSNMHGDIWEAIKHYPFYKYFDGIVISGHVKLAKPDSAIYRYILEKYKLKASESIFLDDKLENVDAATALGIQGIHFLSDKDNFSELDSIIENAS